MSKRIFTLWEEDNDVSFNITDLIVLVILAACMIGCFKRGLILSLFSLVSGVLSILMAWWMYPVVAKMLRGSEGFYNWLSNFISGALNLDGLITSHTADAQAQLIQGLHLPDFLVNGLLQNNNPVLYGVLNVDNVENYIVGYLANICINVLSFLLVIIIVMIVMRIVRGILSFINHIPLVGTLNRVGGLAVGLAEGAIAIWLLMLIPLIFPAGAKAILDMVSSSALASWFYAHNMLTAIVDKIVM